MAIENFVKRIQDIMRQDAGVNGDAQRIEQMAWILFLKIYDEREREWEHIEDNYKSIIPKKFRWKDWAVDDKNGKALTGEELVTFVDKELFPTLKNIVITDKTEIRKVVVRSAIEDNHNYMKDGVLLRQVINEVDALALARDQDRDAFGEIYETILRSLQSAGTAGEYYTPRAVTEFMAKIIAPKLGEKVADLACGTGGFLTSYLNELKPQIKSAKDKTKYNKSIFGIEKKPLPHLLCVINMLLHEIDNPQIFHGNSLERKVTEYTENEKFDIILMNPPYGGTEQKIIKSNFPTDLRSSETADLFMSVIMYRLKHNGRCAVVLPNSFLFGDEVKARIKEKLVKEFNLHTIIRLPKNVFAPYTTTPTNILFFDKTKATETIWVYRLDMPEGYKNFSKTKPIQLAHFKPVCDWWYNHKEETIDGFDKSKCYSVADLAKTNYNFDLCGFPHTEEEILPPAKLIANYQTTKASLDSKINRVIAKINSLLEDKQ